MSVLAGICSCRMGRGSAAEEDAGVVVTSLIYLQSALLLEGVRAIVRKFTHTFANIVKGAVVSFFAGPARSELGVPTLREFFHARHVDAAVVQVVLDVGKICGKKTAVGADAVST